MRARRIVLFILVPCLVYGALLITGAYSQEAHSYVPEKGFVPDVETAIAIAVAVWNPIYGKEQIAREKPYVATLTGDVWSVVGSLPNAPNGAPVSGGVAMIAISKRSGCILTVTHGE